MGKKKTKNLGDDVFGVRTTMQGVVRHGRSMILLVLLRTSSTRRRLMRPNCFFLVAIQYCLETTCADTLLVYFYGHLGRCILFLYHALGGDPAEGRSSTRHEAVSGLFRGRYKLIVASNRDEFQDRPSTPMHFWTDAGSYILAGIICGTARGRVVLFCLFCDSGLQILIV